MTGPMTDERLAGLRSTLERGERFEGKIRGWVRNETEMLYLKGIDIDDVRSLLARLDDAEELIRDIGRCAAPFRTNIDRWVAIGLDQVTFDRIRAYWTKENPTT